MLASMFASITACVAAFSARTSAHPAAIMAEGDAMFFGQPLAVVVLRALVCVGLLLLSVLVPQVLGLLIQFADTHASAAVDPVNRWFYGFWTMLLLVMVAIAIRQGVRGLRPLLVARRRGRRAIEGLPDYTIDWSQIPRVSLLLLAEHIGMPMAHTDAATVRRTWIRLFASKNRSIKGIALHELHRDFPFAVQIS